MAELAPALDVRSLQKRYARGKLAVAGVDLEVKAGELVGLLGPNGAGKSTLSGATGGSSERAALRPSPGSPGTGRRTGRCRPRCCSARPSW
jgi:ABC-type glutathione transport system ATPase component